MSYTTITKTPLTRVRTPFTGPSCANSASDARIASYFVHCGELEMQSIDVRGLVTAVNANHVADWWPLGVGKEPRSALRLRPAHPPATSALAEDKACLCVWESIESSEGRSRLRQSAV
jgi:hypothetical protein